MKKFQFVTLTFCVLAILAILYFSEVNRFVLLLGVYPSIFFGFIGLYAYYEKHF